MAAAERLPRGALQFLLTHLVTVASVAAEHGSAVVPRLGGVICEVVDMMEGCWWKLPVYRSEMRWSAIFLTTHLPTHLAYPLKFTVKKHCCGALYFNLSIIP